MDNMFRRAVARAELAHYAVADFSPALAQYLVTHAHRQKILSRVSLRECYHLFQLRTSQQAHESIRGPMLEAMRMVVDVHPELFQYLKLRNAPDWWPFGQ